MIDLGIVVPAYDEEEGIGEVIDRIKASCLGAHLLIIDDHSKDKTASIAAKKGVEVISNPANLGYGGSLKLGYHYLTTRPHNAIAYLASLDADGTYPPERIRDLYNICKEKDSDMVVGSRFLKKNKGMPLIRGIGNRIFAGLLSFYSGNKVTDVATGLRIFKAQFVPMLLPLPNGLDFVTALTTVAIFEGLTYKEIPINYYKRAGRSKLNSLKDGYRFLRIIMNASRKYKPMLFFVTLGIPFLIIDSLIEFFSRNHHG